MTLRYSITPVIHCQAVSIPTSELVVRAWGEGQQSGVRRETGTELSKIKTFMCPIVLFYCIWLDLRPELSENTLVSLNNVHVLWPKIDAPSKTAWKSGSSSCKAVHVTVLSLNLNNIKFMNNNNNVVFFSSMIGYRTLKNELGCLISKLSLLLGLG